MLIRLSQQMVRAVRVAIAAVAAAAIVSTVSAANAAIRTEPYNPTPARVVQKAPQKPRPSATPRPTATPPLTATPFPATSPTPTVTTSPFASTTPSLAPSTPGCEGSVVYGGHSHCVGYLSGVKSRYYGIGVRVAISATVESVNGRSVLLSSSFWCPPGRWCGAIVTDHLLITFPSGAGLPAPRQIIRIYGTTTQGTMIGGLEPAGFDVLGVAPICDPDYDLC
jgi:hypothetical protein